MKLVEAVPNFSLGRNVRDFYFLQKVLSGKNVWLLDYSRDIDHNRTVATLVGTPAGLKRVMIKAVARMIELVDMSCHMGVHPCLGSTDVVPFVPLTKATMADCVRLACETGQILAEKFGLPVYLYEKAARQKARQNLADIRKGGLKTLTRKIETVEGAPDFGPTKIHRRAGAVVVGARDFLIAFNVNFASRNLAVAKKIAARIRTKNNGLPGIKAIGLYLKSKKCVQVSVNVCDFKKTGLMKLMTGIRNLAKIFKLKIKNSEIIGLVPAAALTGLDPEFLALPGAGKKSRQFRDKFKGRLYKWE